MAKEKVLIVEDRRENLVFLANQILRPNGYEVITAGDGQAGLDKALEEEPDLIIMDFRMPKMTGIQVLQALSDAGKDIPVIVTTFHGSEELAIEAFRLGARDYLIKPYEVGEMLAAVDRALAPRRRLVSATTRLQEDVNQVQRQLEKRVKELHILSGIGKAVTSILQVEKILQRIVEAASYLTGAEESFLMLIDEDSGELNMRAMQGMGKRYKSFRQKVDDSVAGQVVRTGRAVRIGRGRKNKTHEAMTGYLVRDVLNVPLKVRDKVIGVLGVDNIGDKGEFTENDEYLLSTLADYAAIALDNANLYELMEERAQELTQLITARGEEESGRERTGSEQAEQLTVQEEHWREQVDHVARISEQLSSLAIQLNAVLTEIADKAAEGK
jgi:two-component system NtrC family sensor kinase